MLPWPTLLSGLTNARAVVTQARGMSSLGLFRSVLQAQAFGFRAHFVESVAALDVALEFEGKDIGESQSPMPSSCA